VTSTGSITHWIVQLKGGDHAAAQKLWEAYFQKMVDLARQKLHGMPRRAADEEDVALSAFNSFCQGAGARRFPQLQDRNSLWPLLVAITANKTVDLVRHERRLKRGGPPVTGAAVAAEADVKAIIGREPTPEFALQVAEQCEVLLDLALQVAEQCEVLLDRLGDEGLRSVALWRMEGYTVDEIAVRLGCVRRTVERKLRAIRELWGEATLP